MAATPRQSISQGSNAAGPTGAWPAVAARRAGADLVSLGLGGSALLDPFVATTMRDTAADLTARSGPGGPRPPRHDP